MAVWLPLVHAERSSTSGRPAVTAASQSSGQQLQQCSSTCSRQEMGVWRAKVSGNKKSRECNSYDRATAMYTVITSNSS